MRIYHVGAHPSLKKVDGLNATIWLVAREQALMGHQVTLIFNSDPDETAVVFAEQNNIRLVKVPTKTYWKISLYETQTIRSLLREDKPDIVHMHNVFLPKQALLANVLIQHKIPYIITPNALTPKFFQRNWLKKQLYSFLVERSRFMRASAIVGVTPGEAETIRSFVPQYRGKIANVSNPIDTKSLGSSKLWRCSLEKKQLVYLGRFDVWHKGIDILIEIARHLPPDIELHLYGDGAGKTQQWLSQLQNQLPQNVYFHTPVFGEDKSKVLSEATLYIQTSRWEVFGLSIAEAMYQGVPCAIAETLCLSEVLRDHDLGLVLSTNPQEAALQITQALSQPELLKSWSERSHDFAERHFAPPKVASDYIDLYKEILLA